MKRSKTRTQTEDLLRRGNLSIEEAALLLDAPEAIVTRWCELRRIPHARLTKQGWRIPARGLSFFLLRKLECHYSVASAAAMTDMSEATIRAWIADGSLKAIKTGVEKTDSVRIPESELMRRLRA